MRRRVFALLALYGLLLAASHATTALRGEPAPGAAVRAGPAPRADAPVVVLLGFDPERRAAPDDLAATLATQFRVLAPAASGASFAAQAQEIRSMLDAQAAGRVHVVGIGAGGGVALELASLAPDRVASLALVGSIGAAEFELLGSDALNRLLRGLQLAAIEAARALLPHFGVLDRAASPMDARARFASDQARLRPILAAWAGPALVVHGEADRAAPLAAAHESHRLMPQSEFVVVRAPSEHGGATATAIAGFVARAEAGQAATRASAEPARIAQAARPFEAAVAGPHGVAGITLFALLVLAASFASEDLTCIGVGLLAGSQQIGLGLAIAAAVFALFAGDLVLVFAGRFLGPAKLARVSLRGVGPSALLVSRFVPGARLPTYLAAGALRMPLASVALWLAIGALLWAPLVVGAAASLGSMAFERIAAYRHQALPAAIAIALLLLVLLRIAPRLATFRGRRLLLGTWRRWTRFEFWPIWLLYAPVVPWIAWLALRHRGLALVTAVNPVMPGGGLLGESKREILAALTAAAPELVARTRFVPSGAPAAERAAIVRAFQREAGLGFPIVLKPDVGERGSGVAIVREDAGIDVFVAAHPEDLLVQPYVPGREFGLFYLRRPSETHGRLFSVTDKRMIAVTGDGRSTLETLILGDARAVCLAPMHLATHAASLARVPAAGERVPLVEVGTHSRGALFLDGAELATPALAAAIDRVSRAYPGFFFGRYDVRTDSLEAFQQGRGFQIVELNGLTAEATHFYDPRHGLGYAYRVLFEQWRLAFEIAAENRALGARPARFAELYELWRTRQSARNQRVRPVRASRRASSAVK